MNFINSILEDLEFLGCYMCDDFYICILAQTKKIFNYEFHREYMIKCKTFKVSYDCEVNFYDFDCILKIGVEI